MVKVLQASLGLAYVCQKRKWDKLMFECIENMVKLKEEASELADREFATNVSPQTVLLAFFGKASITSFPRDDSAVDVGVFRSL